VKLDRGTPAAERPLLSFSRGDVAEVMAVEAETSVVVRTAGRWQLVRPVVDAADGGSVESLLEQLGEVRAERSFPAGGSRKQFGLAPPALTVVARSASSELALLTLGGRNPAGDHRYAQTADSAVICLVPDGVFFRLSSAVGGLRSRRVLEPDAGTVDTLRCTIGDSAVVLARTAEGWRIDEPRPARADEALVRSLLRRLGEPVVRGYVPQEACEPAATWILRGAGYADTLRVCLPRPESLIVRSSARSWTLAVDTSLTPLLLAGWDSWRDRSVLPFPPFEIQAIRMTGPAGDALALTRTEQGSWLVGADPADGSAVMRLIRGFEAARVESFLNGAGDGMWPPELVIAFTRADGETAIINVGPRRKAARLVRANHLGGCAVARGIEPDSLSRDPRCWRSRMVIEMDTELVDSIDLRIGEVAASARRSLDGWKTSEQWTTEASPESLLSMIRDARIARFTEDIGAVEGPEEMAALRLALGDRVVELSLVRAGGDSTLVRVNAGPPLGLAGSIVPRLRRWLRTAEG
jgi:hypothetical protein